MPKLTMPLLEMKTALKAVLPYSSPEDVTPIITHVHVIPATDPTPEHQGYLVTTDRYTVGRYSLPFAPDEEFLITQKAARFASTINPAGLRRPRQPEGYTVTISTDTLATTVTVHDNATGEAELVRKFDAPYVGIFPPVSRLFPTENTVPENMEEVEENEDFVIQLAGKFLGRFVEASQRANVPLRFRFFKWESDKPAPVLITIGSRFSGLLQPNMILR